MERIFSKNFALISLTGALVLSSSCSTLMGKLRKDLDDSPPRFNEEPTYGGMWPEKGELQRVERNYTRYDSVGHSERAPAGRDVYDPSVPGGWVTEKDRDDQEIAAGYGQYGDEPRRVPAYSQGRDIVPKTKGYYEKKLRMRAEDFYDEDQTSGSLWSSTGQTNYFFVKNSIKGPGDLLTITIKENIVQDIANEVKKTLTKPELKDELLSAQDAEVAAKKAELIAEIKKRQAKEARRNPAAATAQQPIAGDKAGGVDGVDGGLQADIDAGIDIPDPEPTITYRTLNLKQHVGVQPDEKFMAEILERYPNGNYKIRGTKRIPYKGETRLVTIVGIVTAKALDDKETIATDQMYEYMVKAYR